MKVGNNYVNMEKYRGDTENLMGNQRHFHTNFPIKYLGKR